MKKVSLLSKFNELESEQQTRLMDSAIKNMAEVSITEGNESGDQEKYEEMCERLAYLFLVLGGIDHVGNLIDDILAKEDVIFARFKKEMDSLEES